MAAIHSKNTSIEMKVFRALRHRKIYFRRHYERILGTPDIAIPSKKILVFIDGDFWHGFHYKLWGKRLNRYWRRKIERNRERDRIYHSLLRKQGWHVLRIWEHQLNQDFNKYLSKIVSFIDK